MNNPEIKTKRSFEDYKRAMKKKNELRQAEIKFYSNIILDKKLRVPFDLNLTVEAEQLGSVLEPNFLSDLKTEYPEYFL